MTPTSYYVRRVFSFESLLLLYVLTLMEALLAGALVGFAMFDRTGTPVGSYVSAVLKVCVCIIFPASFFVAACSVMLPERMDIRLFYLMFSALFLVNAISVDTASAQPFYIFTKGDLAKIIWRHPKFPTMYWESAAMNLLFMLGSGIAAVALVAVKRRFWRNE